MKNIPLSQGKFALVDDIDFERVNRFKWCATKTKQGYWYPKRKVRLENGRTTSCMLHRFILNAPKGLDVDHENNDGLDNRRQNIRICTRSQNNANRHKHSNQSGYRGVYKHFNKWRIERKVGNKVLSRQSFATPEEAAHAKYEQLQSDFGEFANMNQ